MESWEMYKGAGIEPKRRTSYDGCHWEVRGWGRNLMCRILEVAGLPESSKEASAVEGELLGVGVK